MTTNPVIVDAQPVVRQRVVRTYLASILIGVAYLGAYPAHAQAAPAVETDRDTFLRAVAQVETGGNPRAIGSRGERGLYQFTRSTWHHYTSRSFVEAHNPGTSYVIAVHHYNWLQARFKAAGRPVTPVTMATAWNAGLSRALSGRIPRSTRHYANRVSNLVAVYQRAIPAAHPAPVMMAAHMARIPAMATTIRFAIDDTPADDMAAPEVVPVADAGAEVAFNLSRSTETSPRLRFMFATIGE